MTGEDKVLDSALSVIMTAPVPIAVFFKKSRLFNVISLLS
jgi:hypothetical protein